LRRREICIFFIAVLVSAARPGFGVVTPLGGLKVCLLPLADLTPAGNVGEYTEIISDDLRLELEQAGVSMVSMDKVREVVANRPIPARDLLDPRAAVSTALAAGGDIALSGYVALQDDALQVSLRVYDVTTGVLLTGLLRSYPFDISLYSRLWQDVLEMLEQAVSDPGSSARGALPAAAASPQSPTLTFASSQEGMEVLLPGGKSLGRISKGRLTLPADAVDIRYPLVVEKRLDSHHSARQTVKGDGVTVLSPLARDSGFAVETNWTVGQLLGLGTAFRLYLSPDTIFVAPSVYFSGQPPVGPGGNPAFHVDAGILVGVYLFLPPESPFRLGVSTGAGAIFSWVQSTSLPVFFDPYVDIASLWVEASLPWFSLTLRSDVKYTLGGQAPNLLGQGVILWAGFLPPISLGVLFRW
jgi:hypothetical protein